MTDCRHRPRQPQWEDDAMQQYLDLVSRVMSEGATKDQRAILASTKEKPKVKSVFGHQFRVDLGAGFPLLTTKEMNFRFIAVELIWFLRGDTNVEYLRQHGVRIWDQWTNEKGDLGPIYGKQWRAWESPDGRRVDQIAEVIKGIREVKADPQSPKARRLIVCAWNPADVYGPDVIYSPLACHTLFQFYVNGDRLSCQLYQRSADLFLGVPYNIACYALLTHLVAKVTGLVAHEFIHSFGDAHVYENHFEQVKEQMGRTPYPLPTLTLDDNIMSLDDLAPEQMNVVNYKHHPRLKGEVAV
jgi:thymidylate synthase